MELNVSENKAIVPQHLVGIKKHYQIVLNEEVGDVLRETSRPNKNGKGEFKQYTLFLQDKDKQKYEINFLFAPQLRELVTNYGKNTQDWANKAIEVTGSPREVNGKVFYDAVISCYDASEFITEKV